MQSTNQQLTRALLLGLSCADALGVPVEFQSREQLARNPVTGVRGYGTYDQPPGTFSDDSTMAFCLAETIIASGGRLPLDYRDLANRFINWVDYGYWTPHGELFDIGNGTRAAVNRLRDLDTNPITAGGAGERDNGNGSLMRILPLVTLTPKLDRDAKVRLVTEVSSLTHAHPRSVLCCLHYLLVAEKLVAGQTWTQAYFDASDDLRLDILPHHPTLAAEASHLSRVLSGELYDGRVGFGESTTAGRADIAEADIRGSGYVVHCLEASLYCISHTDSYEAAVLKAIHLGEDTDTTACVTGGLAALLYGEDAIPDAWRYTLVRREDIEDLAVRLAACTAI